MTFHTKYLISSTFGLMRARDYQLAQKNPESACTPNMDKIKRLDTLCQQVCRLLEQICEIRSEWNELLEAYLQGQIIPETQVNPFVAKNQKLTKTPTYKDAQTRINYFNPEDNTIRSKELHFSASNNFEFLAPDLCEEEVEKLDQLPETEGSRRAIIELKDLQSKLAERQKLEAENTEILISREATLQTLIERRQRLEMRIADLCMRMPQDEES
ncbi:hypothetical protein Ciccas_011878 [Cichlidogyrus casuarinus]|uniref:Uncharacterized protein n=1 Tax=Cichlidogyrus casuarinus TaxID=1844966 RepID=A0ABD2PPZ8_9PLAT